MRMGLGKSVTQIFAPMSYTTRGGKPGWIGSGGDKFWGKKGYQKALASFGAQGVKKTGVTGLGRLAGFAVPGLGLLMTGLMLNELYKYTQTTDVATGGYITPMAQGGSAMGGRPYLVGEQGPELFMPGTSGQLLNNPQTNSLLGGKIVLKDVSIGIDSFGGLV